MGLLHACDPNVDSANSAVTGVPTADGIDMTAALLNDNTTCTAVHFGGHRSDFFYFFLKERKREDRRGQRINKW